MHNDNIYFNLDQINHYIYDGQNNFDEYRILIYMQYENFNLNHLISYVTKPKMEIIIISENTYKCKQYCQFIKPSEINQKNLGLFDLIVLDDLKDNLIQSIKSFMKSSCVLQFSVFGKICMDRIKNYNEILSVCPEESESIKELFPNFDISQFSNVIQKSSFTVKDIQNMIIKNKFFFVCFSKSNKYKYKKRKLPPSVKKLDAYYVNEIYSRNIWKHVFMVTNFKPIKAKIEDIHNIPILNNITLNEIKDITDYFYSIKKNNMTNNDILKIKLKFDLGYRKNYICYLLNNYTVQVLLNVDNKKSLLEIFNIVRTRLKDNISNQDLIKIIKPVLLKMETYDFILLKKK